MLYNYEHSVFARFTFFIFFNCMPTFLSSPCMYAIQKDFVMLNNVQKNSASSLKIAIVLPVYNVALYLEECLQSIFSQSYENFTVFAVNDGSTDTSGTILAKYKQYENRLHIIEQDNAGLSAARNTALDQIQKYDCYDYVAFVDSDDRLTPLFLQRLVSTAASSKADIVVCGMDRFNEHGIIKSNDIPYSITNLTRNDFINLIFKNTTPKQIGWGGFVVKQLFRASILKNLKFPLGNLIEDEYFCLSAAAKSYKISYISEKLYEYRQRTDSLSQTPDVSMKLMEGRKLCLSIAKNISNEAYSIVLAAFISSVVNCYRSNGTACIIQPEIQQTTKKLQEQHLISTNTAKRFLMICNHPTLAYLWHFAHKIKANLRNKRNINYRQ